MRLNKPFNPTAGIGDPYWYEWSVGQSYIIDMLNPDSGIESVILQTSDIQGLDDVIVNRNGGVTEAFQIKHTRNVDHITFGDLVSVDNNGDSLLKNIARAWKEGKTKWDRCIPILFTNKIVGERSSTVHNNRDDKFTRPALNKFWIHIQGNLSNAVELSDILVPDDWSEAWQEWLSQLKVLEQEEIVDFLKSLRIMTDQLNLRELSSGLINKLATTFGISIGQAEHLLALLDHSLREWATTLRKSKFIDREEVYTKLSLSAAESVGDHYLVPPEPFFPSRKKFIENLENQLLQGSCPIVFLTGAPGIGKTSIVSELANNRDPIVDLRYHAFRPITPDVTVLPADVGETTKAEVLWGDLLSQLRVIFRGRLARYNVPIRNEFLSIENLRTEVLKLAEIFGKERCRPTVIAIDGIDHAARAGVDQHSFLESLIPPEGVPDHVRFLIVGQPVEYYDKYPHWLKNQNQNISTWEIDGIKEDDIVSLLSSIGTKLPEEEFDAAVRLIDDIADGNTLAAIFAVHESMQCENIQELQEKLNHRRLANGISNYYESIWSSALNRLTGIYQFIGYRLAGCLSLSTERLNGKSLSKIFQELSVPEEEWTNILRSLRPLVIEEPEGYRVTHNDVRVHLAKVISSQPDRLVEVASKMADYYWHNESKGNARHSDVFNLLHLSGRDLEKVKLFTPLYLMEAFALDRPLYELSEQCKQTLAVLPDCGDWDDIHNVACAISTFKQLLKSVDWSGGKFEPSLIVPPVLLSEGRVPKPELWTLDIIQNSLDDAYKLIQAGELHRSRGLVKRWLSGISPIKLINMLPSNEVFLEDTSDSERLEERATDILRLWGRVSQHTGLTWTTDSILLPEHKGEQLERYILAAFFGGYLEEALDNGGKVRWIRAIKKSLTFFWNDLETYLDTLAKSRRWVEIVFVLHYLNVEREECPISFQIRAAAYSLLSFKTDLFPIWVEPIASEGFKSLKDVKSHYEDDAVLFCMVSFILGWVNPHLESGDIGSEGLEYYFQQSRDERKKGNAAVMFNASALAGKWMGVILRGRKESAKTIITTEELQSVLTVLFDQSTKLWRITSGAKDITKNIIEILIEASERVGDGFVDITYRQIRLHASFFLVNYHLDIWWPYLADRGEYDLLSKWFNHWCGTDGKVWHLDVSERQDIVKRFVGLALSIGWQSEVSDVLNRLKWGMISYTGHKEYVLNSPISWYKQLTTISPSCWEKEGKLLLELSQEASRVGDNRMALSVDATFMTSVAACGVSDVWRFYTAENVDDPIKENPYMLFEGLIGMLKQTDIAEDELLLLWAFGVGVFSWRCGEDQVYLDNLRRGILIAGKKRGIVDLKEKLMKIGPAEYETIGKTERYRFPIQWINGGDEYSEPSEKLGSLYRVLDNLSLSESISKLEKLLIDESDFTNGDIWRGARYIARRLRNERPSGFGKYIDRLLSLLKKRKYFYSWTYDSIHTAYEEVVPLLQERQQVDLLHDIIARVTDERDIRLWLDSIDENLELLCRFRASSLGQEEIRKGLNRILSTHELWISGNGKLPEVSRINIPDSPQVNSPTTWSQFATRYLIDILKIDSGTRIETALRGLWGITELSPRDILIIESAWDGLHERAKEWVLLLAERAAVTLPSSYFVFSKIVNQCYEGYNLKLKLQAWVVLQAYERSTGVQSSEWGLIESPASTIIDNLSFENETGVLDIPSKALGTVYSSSGIRTVKSTLELLEAAVMENLEDIEMKYMAYTKEISPTPSVIEKSKKRDGDMLIVHSPELDRLMEILYHEMYKGRWSDVPLGRIAQAFTNSDDPFILLKSPVVSFDEESWPIDGELEKLLVDRDELQARLSPLIRAGLADDEMVLGAVLNSYCRKADVNLIYDATIKHEQLALARVPQTSTFNGRSFLFYDIERFDPQDEPSPIMRMTHQSGGMGNFVNQSILSYPSHIWSTYFDWHPSSHDPTIWYSGSSPIIRLEYFRGPVRDLLQDWNFRQPIMQRWVCFMEDFERAISKYKGAIVKPSIFVRVQHRLCRRHDFYGCRRSQTTDAVHRTPGRMDVLTAVDASRRAAGTPAVHQLGGKAFIRPEGRYGCE